MGNLFEIQKLLTKYYHYVLMYTTLGEKAKKYLLERKIDVDTMKKFKIGFAPMDVRPTLEFLVYGNIKVESIATKM